MILGGSEGDVCIVSLKGFGGKDWVNLRVKFVKVY